MHTFDYTVVSFAHSFILGIPHNIKILKNKNVSHTFFRINTWVKKNYNNNPQ